MWTSEMYSTICVEWAEDHAFHYQWPWPLIFWPQICSPPPVTVSRVSIKFEFSSAFWFRMNLSHGRNRRTGGVQRFIRPPRRTAEQLGIKTKYDEPMLSADEETRQPITEMRNVTHGLTADNFGRIKRQLTFSSQRQDCCVRLSLLPQERGETFLPARRYASAGNSDRNVSVRPSVTRRYCAKTKKASVMISSPSGRPNDSSFLSPNFITTF